MSSPVLEFKSTTEEKPTLSRQTSRGMAWLMMQMGVGKVVGMAGQVFLTWLLTKEAFGLIALTYAITAYTGLVQKTGLTTILVQRQNRFDRWATPAFWLSLALSCVAGLLIIGSAPLAERIFNDNRLPGLLYVMALTAPIEALFTVPLAKLQTQLRFAYLAKLGFAAQILTISLTVLLAWMGFGAYSILLPRPFVSILLALTYWHASKVRLHGTPRFKRWRYLITDSTTLMATMFFLQVIMHCDSLFLKVFHTTEEVGVYYFAFNMSMQTIRFLTGNLAEVLFPALSQMAGNAARQTQAFIRAACNLSFVGIPLIFLHAALAEPAINVLFHDRWEVAIPVFRVLSLGMLMVIVTGPTQSILYSQGRYFFHMCYMGAAAFCFVFAVAAGSYYGGVLMVGTIVALFNVVTNPLLTYLAIRPQGGGWRDLVRIFVRPVILSFAAWGGTAVVVMAMELRWPIITDDRIQLMLIPTGTLLGYIALSRIFAVHIMADFLSQIRELLTPLRR